MKRTFFIASVTSAAALLALPTSKPALAFFPASKIAAKYTVFLLTSEELKTFPFITNSEGDYTYVYRGYGQLDISEVKIMRQDDYIIFHDKNPFFLFHGDMLTIHYLEPKYN